LDEVEHVLETTDVERIGDVGVWGIEDVWGISVVGTGIGSVRDVRSASGGGTGAAEIEDLGNIVEVCSPRSESGCICEEELYVGAWGCASVLFVFVNSVQVKKGGVAERGRETNVRRIQSKLTEGLTIVSPTWPAG
jgi:hypothetical protein